MVEGGEKGWKREFARRERVCLYQEDIKRERKRKKESLHAKLRKRMGLSDDLTRGTIARFSRRVSPNNHRMSHDVSMFASSLPIAVSPSISVSYNPRKNPYYTHTHARHTGSHDAICKNRK